MKSNGYTIIEMIIVMVLVGILALSINVVINRGGGAAMAEAEVLKANLRFTQSRAMSDLPGNIWSLNVTASAYTIQRNGGVPSPTVALPGSNSGTYSLPNGQTITSGIGLIRFNFRGQPVDASGSPLAANVTITVNGASPAIVTRETGFVP